MLSAPDPNDHFSFWAILGSLLSVAATLLVYFLGKIRFWGKVKLVNVEISDLDTEAHTVHFNLPVIDITFRNDRRKTAVVTGIEVQVKNTWGLVLQFPVMQALPVSGSYTLLLDPLRQPPYTLQVPISHMLKADEADRIQLTLGLDPLKPFESFYRLSVRFVDDQGSKSNPLDFVLVLPDMTLSGVKREYFLSDFEKRFKEHQNKTWSSPSTKAIADLLFNRAAAQEKHMHNKLSILRASLCAGYRNNRAAELIRIFQSNQF